MRGFDSYELKLGDELRGERASKGKSLLDVQRDLRIRADYIDAIENADASAFPFSGFAAGYVRSYARYLDMDGDDVYRRFCEESGFAGVEKAIGPAAHKAAIITAKPDMAEDLSETAPPRPVVKKTNGADAAVISTRFMKSNQTASRGDLGAGLRGMMSVMILAGMVVGLGYGGWSVLQNLQRVGFAPLPSAPEVLVRAPDIFAPSEGVVARTEAAEPADQERVSLAALYADQEVVAPTVVPRDGPISTIDPARAGIYAVPEMEPVAVIADASFTTFEGEPIVVDTTVDPALAQAARAAAEMAANKVNVVATDDAWVRIRDGSRGVLFTGILGPGEQFSLPGELTEPQLRAGNAGAVYLMVGDVAYGPLGAGPEIAKNVVLTPEAIRKNYPAAADVALPQEEQFKEAQAVAGVTLQAELQPTE
ncbi:MAG: RodZ domain-containing protein [Pseudomonadota bacterium]